jgi:hypothetical protein
VAGLTTYYETAVNADKASTMSTLQSLSGHSFHKLMRITHTGVLPLGFCLMSGLTCILTAPSERWPVEDGSIRVQMEADVLGLDFLQGGGDLGAGRQVQGGRHLLSHLLVAIAPHSHERDGDGSGDQYERKCWMRRSHV